MTQKTTLNEIGEMLTHVVQHMERVATKDDVALLHSQINSIEAELRAIKSTLMRVVYHDELSAALERIAAIERHLGINKKISA